MVLANANNHSRAAGALQSVVVKNRGAFSPGHAKNQARISAVGGSVRCVEYSNSVCSLISPKSDNEIQHIVTNGLRFGTSTHAGINRPSNSKKILDWSFEFDVTDIVRPALRKREFSLSHS